MSRNVQHEAAQQTDHAFRPEIEGLRAVAVLSVVVFHLGARRLPGGFTGVDVFFVISGYLITGIIARELSRGSFSLWHFYERRARRILPALTVMLLMVTATSAVYLFDGEILQVRKSQLAAAFFGSNILFWRTSDYFATPSAEQPLLHTWSLGVEEQFYVLFPLLMLAVFAARRSVLRPVLWAITVTSFVASVILARMAPTAAFYLLPTRAWELGAGALLAVGAVRTTRTGWRSHAISTAGLALLGWSFLRVQEGAPFPGEHALPAVLGSVALIAAGGSSVGGRLLSLGPVRWLGRLSYSLYLWHWPVIVLYRVTHPGPLNNRERLVLGLVSLGAAALSWRFVERPVRHLRLPRRRHIAVFAASSMLVAAGAAYAAEPLHSLRRENPAVDTLLDGLRDRPDYRGGTCFMSSMSSGLSFRRDVCLAPDPARSDWLLVGDSHAADLWAALKSTLPEVNLMQATGSGCKPLVPLQGQPRCTEVLRQALAGPLAGRSVDAVVVSARWTFDDLQRLPATLRLLRQHTRRVIVLGPTTEYMTALPTLLARGVRNGDPQLAQRNLVATQFALDAPLRKVVERGGATYVSQLTLLCTASGCRTTLEGNLPIKTDYGHYSRAGALYVARAMHPLLVVTATK